MTDLRPDTRVPRMRNTARGMPPPHPTPPPLDEPAEERALEELQASPSAPRPPAADGQPPRRGGGKGPVATVRSMPAGHAILVAAGALLFAMIFNSHAMVHAGEGMKDGTTRTLVLG